MAKGGKGAKGGGKDERRAKKATQNRDREHRRESRRVLDRSELTQFDPERKMTAIQAWERAVCAVKSATSQRAIGSCFVIDAQRGLLWSCSHVVGEDIGRPWQIGMASATGQPITWMYEARVVHSTPGQPGLDGALLWITARTPTESAVLPLHPLTHADGQPLPALPLGDGKPLPGGEPAILLGYPGVTQVMTPTVGIYCNQRDYGADGGVFLITDSVMIPGHSGGPGLNQRGEVVGWNVRHAELAVRDAESFTVSFKDGSRAWHTMTVACGVNELRPVSRLVAELQALQGQVAQDAFGGSAPADVRGFLTTKLGCIPAGTHPFGSAAFDVAMVAAEAAMVAAEAAAKRAEDAAGAAETAAARAHHHEQGALAHTLAGASFRDDAARQAGAACSSAAQAASAAATACSAADAVNLLAQQQEKLVSIERDGAVIMCLLPSKHLQPITLPPSSTLAELRSSMADALEDSDLSPSFLFECKMPFLGQPVSVRIPRKVETKWTIAKVLPDEDSSPEVEHARWRRQLLPDLCQKDLRVELRMSDRVRDLLELGRGSFGIVREHELPASRGGGILAVKTIPKHLLLKGTDAEDAAREVRIHEKLAAKGVASTLYGVYEDTGSSGPERLGFEHGLHLVSHRADFDLHQLIVVHAPLPERFAATLCLELLRIVNTAHEVNVALVDVKPENFLLVATGASAVARDRGRPAFGTVPERAALDTWVGDEPAPYQLIATDFGLSQTFESSTRFSRIVGTPYYIAPEVVQQSYSAEADLWSIGVILHQLLTGSSLFEASSLQDSVQALVDFDLTRTLDASALASATISAKALLIQLLQVEPNLRATPADALGACRSWRKIAPSAWYHTDESIGTGPPCIERQASGSLPSEDEADVCRKRARDLSDGVEPTL